MYFFDYHPQHLFFVFKMNRDQGIVKIFQESGTEMVLTRRKSSSKPKPNSIFLNGFQNQQFSEVKYKPRGKRHFN